MRMFALLLAALMLVAPAQAAKRMALVIGNGAYQDLMPLPNAAKDAEAVATMFTDMGFFVSLGLDLYEADMRKTIDDFAIAAQGAEIIAVYYAGHGSMANGEDFLLPVGFNTEKKAAALANAIGFGDVMLRLTGGREKVIAFIDTNRTSAVEGTSPNGNAGFAPQAGGQQILLSFSTAPGGIALDGQGEHSPYTTALLKHLPVKKQDVEKSVKLMRLDVHEATDGRQIPFDFSNLKKPLVLKP